MRIRRKSYLVGVLMVAFVMLAVLSLPFSAAIAKNQENAVVAITASDGLGVAICIGDTMIVASDAKKIGVPEKSGFVTTSDESTAIGPKRAYASVNTSSVTTGSGKCGAASLAPIVSPATTVDQVTAIPSMSGLLSTSSGPPSLVIGKLEVTRTPEIVLLC